MIGAKWFDMVVGIDIHWVLVPAPPGVPVPTPLPHPFTGMIFDPVGLAVSTVISAGVSVITGGGFGGPVFTNNMPSAATGTDATNMLVCPHFPMPPGVAWAPVPAGLKPPIPGKSPDPGIPSPIPSNDATMITGSKTVYVNGTNACRLGDLAMSCGEPIRLPSSTVIAVPMGAPVLIGGPPALDFFAAFMSLIRTQWVSGRLHSLMKAKPGSWKSKAICFLTGHPVDVMSGMVLTDSVELELPGPLPFKLERSYASRSTYKGPLGHGWSHTYDQFIRFEKKRVVLHAGDGRDLYFYPGEGENTARNEHERLDLTMENGRIIVEGPDKLRYVFGKANRLDDTLPLLAVENRAGANIQLHYDEVGRLTHIIDSAGRLIGFHHNAKGQLVRVSTPHPDEEGQRVDMLRYEFDDEGDLIAAYDGTGVPFRYAYKYHLMVQETDRNGLSFYFAYDGIDHDAWCMRTWGDGGLYDHVLTYDKENHVAVVENSLGHQTTYMGNEDGLVVKILDARGGETAYEWDEFRRKTSQTDANGNTTAWKHDARGNIIEVMQPDGGKVEAAYDDRDNRIAGTDPAGGKWQWRFDDLDRLIARIDPLQRQTTFTWRGSQPVQLMRPEGQSFSVTYDEQGNAVKLRSTDGITSGSEFDRLGRLIALKDPHGQVQKHRYDLKGRLIEIHEANGNIHSKTYDPMDNPLHFRSNNTNVTMTYTGLGCLATRTENDLTQTFSYDTEEQLLSMSNGKGETCRFQWDERGKIIEETTFEGAVRTYRRDAVGNIIEQRHPSGKVTQYDYDACNRRTAATYDDGSADKYAWRADGHLMEAVNDQATVQFERDPAGNVLCERQDGHWITSEYNARDLRVRMKSSLGADQVIERNLGGRVMDISYSDTTAETNEAWEARFERDRLGLELSRSLPGNLQSFTSWDKFGRPLRHEVRSNGEIQRNQAYAWGSGTRLKQEEGPDGITRYTRDRAGFLIGAAYADGSRTHRIPDEAGNFYETRDRSDRVYGAGGQLLEMRGTDGNLRFEYDADGNLIRKTGANGGQWHYHWNSAGLLARVERPDGATVDFTYDALGRRIAKTFRGKTTRWLWDEQNPLHEWVDEAASRAESAEKHIPDAVTWLFEPETYMPMARMVGQKRYAVICDYRGVPVSMHDGNGKSVWSMELDIYGRVKTLEGEHTACPFRLPGQYEDEETGLYYNRFRYYDPDTGAYISQDPLRLEGGDRFYGYVDDPTIACDPQGLHQMYAWLISGGEKIPLPGNSKSLQWWSTQTTGRADQYGGINHTEWHFMKSLDGDPRLPGNKVVLVSIGQTRGPKHMSSLPACPDCDAALANFAKKNDVDIEYKWKAKDGTERSKTYPCK